PPHSGVFQAFVKGECHFMNGNEQVRFVQRYFYNRKQLLHFDSDGGHYVGDTPFGEDSGGNWNSKPELLEDRRAQVDTFCRHNYEVSTLFLVDP
ncbi:HB22 protein, partial [Atrichornis clamosus]|nr:HB22 protein [Atrichornis clamosus]